jgi:hypothetical protein
MSDLPEGQATRDGPASGSEGAGETSTLPRTGSTGLESAATAALALAVSSAEKAANHSAHAVRGERVPPPAGGSGQASRRRLPPRYAASAAAVLLALAGGWIGAQIVAAAPAEQPWAEAAGALRRSQEDVVRLTGDVKALKVAVEALKDSVERSRSETGAKQAQLAERLDRTDRAPQEMAAKIDQFAGQLNRIETIARDPIVKLAALGERLDRFERQIAADASNADPKPPAVAAAAPAASSPAAVPQAAPAAVPLPPPSPNSGSDKAKDEPVEGWVLHEVYDGVALIESRNRRLFEVGPGAMVPGVGRVEGIEKRGKRWVVVTAKGIIGTLR